MKLSLLFLLFLTLTGMHFTAWGLTCPAPEPTMTAGKVIINEINSNDGAATNDWIELYVNGGTWNLNGWQVILKGSGNINETITLFTSDLTFPWSTTTTAGRFMVFTSTLSAPSVAAAVASGALIEGTNLFVIPGIGLHNTLQEVLLLDGDGNLVNYIGYANKSNAKFEYDCAEEYPDFADKSISAGNDGAVCTAEDGVTNGDVGGDLIAGCGGQTTLGESNDPTVVSQQFGYRIEHNASGFVNTAQTIVVKACANADCSVVLSEAISSSILLTPGSGSASFSSTVLNYSAGQATTTLTASAAQTVTLALNNSLPAGTFTCLDDLGGTSCNIVFSTTQQSVNHYRIEYDGQGFTCEAKTITLKACADENCSVLYDQPSSLTLSNPGLTGDTTISIPVLPVPAAVTASIGYTDTTPINFTADPSAPTAPLRCFNGGTEIPACLFEFKNAGFEFVGATVGDKTLPDQIAENNFSNVNLRAVKDDGSGACVTLLDDGLRGIDLSFDCDDPSICKTPLNYVSTPLSELVSAKIDLDFTGGIASLSGFNYADVGRLQLSAQALIGGVTLTSGSAQVDVYPLSLALNVAPTNLIYTGAGDIDTYTAGQGFTLSMTAYGAIGLTALPNYQPAELGLKLTRNEPSAASATDGTLTYAAAGTLSSALSPAGFTASSTLAFVDGIYSYSANYNEVGRISIDVQDLNYLGNLIPSRGGVTLGNFIPAYFDIVQNTPSLVNTCGTFSYVGEYIEFDIPLSYTVTAKSALPDGVGGYTTTNNYGNDGWKLALGNNNVFYVDDSANNGAISGNMSSNNTELDYDGQGIYTIAQALGADFVSFTNPVAKIPKTSSLLSPFSASFSTILTTVDIVADPVAPPLIADADGVCFQANYPNGCTPLTGSAIAGASMRYGRLTLDSTYGPDTEPLTVNIKAEYYDGSRWQLNSEDSCTEIDFTEAGTQLILAAVGAPDITDNIASVIPAGGAVRVLSAGESNDNNDLLLSAPAPTSTGVLLLSLNPNAVGVKWPDHLNFDWDGDADIDTDDFPSATITFGQFRGNDKIIQWREIFN